MRSATHLFSKSFVSLQLILLAPFLGAVAHESASFPGTGNQVPAHEHAKLAANSPPPANHHHAHDAQFGGEQLKDEKHIKEHLEGKVDPTENMSPEALQFHYFKMHDTNNDARLDGIELIKAIVHFHEEHPPKEQPSLPNEAQLEEMVDAILREDEHNGDGYISFEEFLYGQKKREEQARQYQAQQAQQQQQQVKQP